MKTVILVGAGSTLSDAKSKPQKDKPPLDKGFFSGCKNKDYSEFYPIENYLKYIYDIDITNLQYDSLERIMAIIYADINTPKLQKQSINAFRNLIQLFNRRIADTTNSLEINKQSNLFKVIAKNISSTSPPSDLSIITFNQDIHIEKTLEALQATKKYSQNGKIFSFPDCYSMEGADSRMTSPKGKSAKIFTKSKDTDGIAIYKLHGSLNWFSTHKSKNVPKNSILSKDKEIRITPRKEIPSDMMFVGKRRTYTFPIIIPPVNHKSAIIHTDLLPIWKDAEAKLSQADTIIVFGYSCPETDFESANMLRRATNSQTKPQSFIVIDPDPHVFHRYVDVTGLDHLSFFRSCQAYINKMN